MKTNQCPSGEVQNMVPLPGYFNFNLDELKKNQKAPAMNVHGRH